MDRLHDFIAIVWALRWVLTALALITVGASYADRLLTHREASC